MNRAMWIAGAAAVAIAAGVTVWAVGSSSEPTDPNETAVTGLCRDAAGDYPGLSGGRLTDFAVDTVTHEGESGIEFYQANGTASASDGFGGQKSYRFSCRAKLDDGQWELIDITML